MERFLVVHYNELGLKKGNRDYFENRLCQHIRAVLADCGGGEVRRISGRILVALKADAGRDEIRKRMKKVFGVAYFAHVGGFLLGVILAALWRLHQPKCDVCYVPEKCTVTHHQPLEA